MSELNRCNRCKSCKYCRQLENVPAWLWNIKLELSANMSPKESRAWCRDFALAAHKDKRFDEARVPILEEALYLLTYLIEKDNRVGKNHYLNCLIDFFADRFNSLRKSLLTAEFIKDTYSGEYLPDSHELDQAVDAAEDYDERRKIANALANVLSRMAAKLEIAYPDFLADVFISVCAIVNKNRRYIDSFCYLPSKLIVLSALKRVERCSVYAPCLHCKRVSEIPDWLRKLKYVLDQPESFESDTEYEGWCRDFAGTVGNCLDYGFVRNEILNHLFYYWLQMCDHEKLRKCIERLQFALTTYANGKELNSIATTVKRLIVSFNRNEQISPTTYHYAVALQGVLNDTQAGHVPVDDIALSFLMETDGDRVAYDDVRERLLSLLNDKKLKSPSNTLAMSAPQQGSFA